jgi:hypothetical protein
MATLNELEAAVLQAMVGQAGKDAAALGDQLKNLDVDHRVNTGAGFFTYFKNFPTTNPISRSVFDGVFAEVSDLNNGMAFVLFIRDGLVSKLEGAAVEESTVDFDFSNAKFEISVLPPR